MNIASKYLFIYKILHIIILTHVQYTKNIVTSLSITCNKMNRNRAMIFHMETFHQHSITVVHSNFNEKFSRVRYPSRLYNTGPSFTFPDRTPVTIPLARRKIQHTSKIFSVGSCFADMMAREMKQRKFDIVSNPQGIVFNVVSIFKTLEDCINTRRFTECDIIQDSQEHSLYHSWNHHSSFSNVNKTAMLSRMNEETQTAHQFLRECNYILITLGTSFVHKLRSTNKVVANCHKQPPALFEKELLTLETTESTLSLIKNLCNIYNPDAQIVFTVSPVRHTREGISNNQRSKALLLCAIHNVVDKYPDKLSYFPAYEIMMDELRDYRWYADDMIHPSATAERVIFNRFAESYFDASTKQICEDILKIKKRIDHRPIVAHSKSYINHLDGTLNAIFDFNKRVGPHHNYFQSEISDIQALVQSLKDSPS